MKSRNGLLSSLIALTSAAWNNPFGRKPSKAPLPDMIKPVKFQPVVEHEYRPVTSGGIKVPRQKKHVRVRSAVVLGRMIRVCPGRRHAWFESSMGMIRKPIPYLECPHV